MKEAVHKVIFLPSQRTVTAKRGEILLDVLRRESQPISAVCGGRGNCGKCKALVAEGSEAFPLTLTEARLLTRDEIAAGYRLSCQFKVMTDVRVKTEDPAVDSAVSKPPLPKALMREISPLVRLEEFSLSHIHHGKGLCLALSGCLHCSILESPKKTIRFTLRFSSG